MFTGIVEELGAVRSVVVEGDSARIDIAASHILSDAFIGASIAVNGCCLTLIEFGQDQWVADAVPETLARTNLGDLVEGSPVNLERPMSGDGRFGGHIVQGHVDAVTTVLNIETLDDDGSWRMTFAIPISLGRYMVEKGSICLDGISLTIASITDTTFDVAVIPHTLAVTTMGKRNVGDTVNIEADILGKHIEKLLASGAVQPSEIPALEGTS